MAALNPIKPLYSASATATNGSTIINVTGNIDCSWLKPGSIVQVGTRQLVDAVSGTVPDGSGNSTITLRRPWADPTTTAPLLAFMSWEGLADAVVKLRALAEANESALQGAFSFMGAWDASPGDFPPAPAENSGTQMYRISVAGTMGGRAYRSGEPIYYDQFTSQWRSFAELASSYSTGLLALANVEAWRTELGLVPTTSPTDTTAWRLLQVGDGDLQTRIFSTGATSSSTVQYFRLGVVDGLTPAIGDALACIITTTGFLGNASRSSYFLEASERGGSFKLDVLQLSYGASSNQEFFYKSIGTHKFEIWVKRPSFDSSFSILALSRARNSTTIIERELVLETIEPSGLVQAAVRKVFDNNNTLGTVSQSAGVPTGAIIQRGSNANGEFVRFADGTQICYVNHTSGFSTPAAYSSGLYRSAKTITYPANFVSNSYVTGGGWSSDNAAEGWSVLRNSSSSTGVLQLFTPTTSPASVEVRAAIFGRWY
ncbi:hypothetical protein [Rheinheimera sp.]|uniref:hypothetical protein n=1 Tax=Rheinheimera sp. TaxID=1869214 RepID=UPI002733BC6C|nr:hypothetical protein [Rheinheimera sp.]MDP2715547.1 hypothetical protein [Rheinheimera sp.]